MPRISGVENLVTGVVILSSVKLDYSLRYFVCFFDSDASLILFLFLVTKTLTAVLNKVPFTLAIVVFAYFDSLFVIRPRILSILSSVSRLSFHYAGFVLVFSFT